MQRSLTVTTNGGLIRKAFHELRKNKVSAILFVGSMLMTACILKFSPPTRDVTSLPSFLIKLVPFLLSAEAIARLELDKSLREILCRFTIPISFLGFFCYFVPRNFYLLDEFAQDYVNMLQAVPYLILCMLFAYRIAGGSTVIVRRLAIAMLLLMLSGLEDLSFLLVNNNSGTRYAGIPKVWFWASHMAIFIGHYPSRAQAFAFIGVHVSLAVTALFAPTRWLTNRLPFTTHISAVAVASPTVAAFPSTNNASDAIDQEFLELRLDDEMVEEAYVCRHLRAPDEDNVNSFGGARR